MAVAGITDCELPRPAAPVSPRRGVLQSRNANHDKRRRRRGNDGSRRAVVTDVSANPKRAQARIRQLPQPRFDRPLRAVARRSDLSNIRHSSRSVFVSSLKHTRPIYHGVPPFFSCRNAAFIYHS